MLPHRAGRRGRPQPAPRAGVSRADATPSRNAGLPAEAPLDPERVLDREAEPVVVEVGVDVALGGPLLDPADPRRELPVCVVPVAASVVKAQEDEVAGELVRLKGT